MTSRKWDAIIIGSGISSLTCAALLSKKGRSVLVLERYNKPGGYMHCFSRFGARFDTGAHYVGAMERGQPFRTLLSYLGVYDERLFVPLDPSGFDVFHFPDFTFEFPKGYAEVIDRLRARFPNENAAIRRYFAMITEVAQNFPTYEFNDQADMLEIGRALETSLATVVSGLTRDPALTSILYAYCALHGVEPGDVPFGLHAILTDSLIRGPYGLAEGGDALTRRFVERIHANGGKVLLKKPVVEIENAGRIANAVITADGERFESDWIIAGCHPKTTFGLIRDPEIFSKAFRDRMAGLRETIGIFGIYGMAAEHSRLSRLRNYYYFSSADPLKLFSETKEDESPRVAFLSPGNRQPAPGEKTAGFSLNIHAASPTAWFSDWKDSKYGDRPASYEARKERFSAEVLSLIESHQPGFRASLTNFVTSSPVTNRHFNGSPDGSSYGIYHSIQNTGARSLGPRTHVANLLITGQSTLFPGLLGAAIAGLRTSGHILGIKPMLRELREMQAL